MPDNQGKGERLWTVDADEYGEVNPEELGQELIGLVSVLTRLGGVVQLAAVRRERDDGLFVTERVIVRWNSYVPSQRKPEVPEPVVEELEPVAVEG